MYTLYMEWIVVGATILILFVVFLALFFKSSGALNIVEEEQEEIEHESPEQLEEEVRQVEQEDAKALKAQEDQFYSHG